MEHFGENPLLKKISFTISNQFSDETRQFKKQNSATFTQENDVVKNYGLVLDAFSEFNKNWSAITGLEYYTDQINSNKTETNTETGLQTVKRGLYPDNSKMNNFALFSQHTLKFNVLQLQFGGRFNANRLKSVDEQFGEVSLNPESVVGNLSFQYLPNSHDNFILSVNSGFRAPNINDISSFGLFDYGIEIPTQDLSPEKTITVEAGYKRLSEASTFSVFAFNTRLKDQIVRVEASYNGSEFIDGERVYTKQNVAKSNIYGIEAESGIKLNRDFSLLNNITWLYGKDLENDKPMRRIPPLNGRIALRYKHSNIHGDMEFLFATKQDRLSSGDIDDHRIPEGGTPGWQILNLNLGYSLKKISINSGIRNIFNQAYRIHGSGVDGLGRSVWLALRFEIGN
jgi:outer membrane cobalamin receptor